MAPMSVYETDRLEFKLELEIPLLFDYIKSLLLTNEHTNESESMGYWTTRGLYRQVADWTTRGCRR